MENMKYNCYAQGQPLLIISPDMKANNNCLVAYREVMTLAINEKACKMSLPPLGSIEDIQQMFKTQPSPGMKVESSLSAPFFFFLSKNKWTSTFTHIVHQGCVWYVGRDGTERDEAFPPAFGAPKMGGTGCSTGQILGTNIPHVFFKNYTFVPSRSIPSAYQTHPKDPAKTQLVIWIENVEVKDCKVDDDDDIQSGTMNSNPAFSTKHEVNILSSICRRTCAKRKISFISFIFYFKTRGDVGGGHGKREMKGWREGWVA
ncbi:unnamed protein product [Malus baccata var. baccata]